MQPPTHTRTAEREHDAQLAEWGEANGFAPGRDRLDKAAQSAVDSAAAFADRHHYRVTIAIEGRIRFLSHLELVDTLLGALRRAGVTLALSDGMRPKPRIKVAMPRPVAVESWADVFEVELEQHVDPDVFALQLSGVLPAGLTLIGIDELEGAYVSAASRVAGAAWRFVYPVGTDAALLDAVVAEALGSDSLMVERTNAKTGAVRQVDVSDFLQSASVVRTGDAPAVRAVVSLTKTGSAKPEELVRALGALAGSSGGVLPTPTRVIRESIVLAETVHDGNVAYPELVGADVPDGPEKPWGAC